LKRVKTLRKKSFAVVAMLVLYFSMVFTNTLPVKANSTQIVVIDPVTGDSNFAFYDNTTAVGTRFNATVWAVNATDVFAFQICLVVDDTQLNITNSWIPTGDPRWIFNGKGIVNAPIRLVDDDQDGYVETVLIGSSLLDRQPTFTGTALLAIIELQIISQPPKDGNLTSTINIADGQPFETYMMDSSLNRISTTLINGQYTYFDPPTLLIGDLNGDGKVDMRDIGYVARRFGCDPGSTLWDPNADFNSDGKIDMKDIAIVARNFGKIQP
jgi:hypothetical protein